jgi:hypothetical protein
VQQLTRRLPKQARALSYQAAKPEPPNTGGNGKCKARRFSVELADRQSIAAVDVDHSSRRSPLLCNKAIPRAE